MTRPIMYLYEYVKRNVNLAEFLETEIGCSLNWHEPNVSASTICPMPFHKDSKPSFQLKFIAEDNVWIYHCLGCDSKGTIIDFFMNFYGLESSSKAVMEICKKFNFKPSNDLDLDSFDNVKKRVNIKKKMELAHIVTSNQCRMLLKKDFNRYNKWVADSYKKMNLALDKEDLETIEAIGFEASNKMGELKCR